MQSIKPPPPPLPPPALLVNRKDSTKSKTLSKLRPNASNEKETTKDQNDMYNDDVAFERHAKNKKKHDAVALANSLYGLRCFPHSKEHLHLHVKASIVDTHIEPVDAHTEPVDAPVDTVSPNVPCVKFDSMTILQTTATNNTVSENTALLDDQKEENTKSGTTTCTLHRNKKRKKHNNIDFAQNIGRFMIDASLLDNIDGNTEEQIGKDEEIEYFALSKDYVLKPVKNHFDFVTSDAKEQENMFGVTTDVLLFDRRLSSEYNEEFTEKRNRMREAGVSTNLSNVMTKENTKRIKEQQRLSQEKEIESLSTSNTNGFISKVAQMKAMIAEKKQQTGVSYSVIEGNDSRQLQLKNVGELKT
eukprot:GFUD01002248.1.p1 GENE.GFUD01002248.1~~GFUD01002248.1.p1  ORF type:complete len:359 (-),score=109.63 GFUD01002248.1:67-1143(-)